MRAVWLEVPHAFLEERARHGHDRKDEIWEGELHMVPPPTYAHERVTFDLMFALKRIADQRGLRVHGPTTGLFAAKDNYRIPDITLFRDGHASEHGLTSAELVVEVTSPNDESRKKLGFYAALGVGEVWLVEPATRIVEILTLAAGTYIAARTGFSPALGITLERVVGPKLRIHAGDETIDV